MALKLPPILEKTMRFKQLEHKDGLFLLWNTPCYIDPIQMRVYEAALIAKECGEETAQVLLYHRAKLQGLMGLSIIMKKYGYAETIKDKLALLNFNKGQYNILGFGNFNLVKADFKNNHFIVNFPTQFAKEYIALFGMQKKPIDHFFAGNLTGVIEAVSGKELTGIETQCLASGGKTCEFIIRETAAWKKNDPLVKRNRVLFDKKRLECISNNWKTLYHK